MGEQNFAETLAYCVLQKLLSKCSENYSQRDSVYFPCEGAAYNSKAIEKYSNDPLLIDVTKALDKLYGEHDNILYYSLSGEKDFEVEKLAARLLEGYKNRK